MPWHDKLITYRTGRTKAKAGKGTLHLAAFYFPAVAEAAAALQPELSAVERLALEPVLEGARDPARLRHLRGAEAAARLVVAP